MENISTSIRYEDTTQKSICFKFTGDGKTTQQLYLKDLVLYDFPINIDYTTNCFSWIEVRTSSGFQNYLYNYVIFDTGLLPTSRNYTLTVLCCLFITPGIYKTLDEIINEINNQLDKIQERVFLKKITVNYDSIKTNIVTSYTFTYSGSDSSYNNGTFPAYIGIEYFRNNFELNEEYYGEDPEINGIVEPCLLMEIDLEREIQDHPVLPDKNNQYYTRLKYNYNNVLMKSHYLNNLTIHQINSVKSISNRLNCKNTVIVPQDAFFVYENYYIQCYNNANNYVEYILDNFNNRLNLSIYLRGNEETFSCIQQPVFPDSSELYVRFCNNLYIDKQLETAGNEENIFSPFLATINLNNSYEIVQQKKIITNNDGTKEEKYEDKLELKYNVPFITIPIELTVNLMPYNEWYLYVTGNNQIYPLYKGEHYTTYIKLS